MTLEARFPALLTPEPSRAGQGAARAAVLVDLFNDGFFLLLLLRSGDAPDSASELAASIEIFLAEVERAAAQAGISAADVQDARYAFCAAMDEAILGSRLDIRQAWESKPLQLALFGDQLAGEHFFARLEQLRINGARRLPALEVYHHCLLLGFKGRYALEGTEKLHYLSARLGEEIADLKGRAAFAPHWQPPDRVLQSLKREVPLWVAGAVCALLAALVFTALDWRLQRQTQNALSEYEQVVALPPSNAHVTITLP